VGATGSQRTDALRRGSRRGREPNKVVVLSLLGFRLLTVACDLASLLGRLVLHNHLPPLYNSMPIDLATWARLGVRSVFPLPRKSGWAAGKMRSKSPTPVPAMAAGREIRTAAAEWDALAARGQWPGTGNPVVDRPSISCGTGLTATVLEEGEPTGRRGPAGPEPPAHDAGSRLQKLFRTGGALARAGQSAGSLPRPCAAHGRAGVAPGDLAA